MTTPDHFDQLAPIDGVHQVQPDGSVQPAPEVRGPGEPPVGKAEDFALPSLPPEYQQEGFQQSVAEQVAAQRAQLEQPAGNVGRDDKPHFLRMVDGREVCGQDGEPFPCAAYQEMSAEARLQALTHATGETPYVPPTMAEAARAAGMDLAEFEARLRATRGL